MRSRGQITPRYGQSRGDFRMENYFAVIHSSPTIPFLAGVKKFEFRLGENVRGVTAQGIPFLAKITAVFKHRAAEHDEGTISLYLHQYFTFAELLPKLNNEDKRLVKGKDDNNSLVLGETEILLKGQQLEWIKNSIIVVNSPKELKDVSPNSRAWVCEFGLEAARVRSLR
jgi:hypothetical protein